MNKTDQIAAAVWDRGGQLGIATVFSIETSKSPIQREWRAQERSN
jgi:hypothetical protein